jgi:hypothetical protein
VYYRYVAQVPAILEGNPVLRKYAVQALTAMVPGIKLFVGDE